MYDRLTPLGRDITDAVMTPSADGSGYFKSAKLLAPDDPSARSRRPAIRCASASGARFTGR
jgi:hypothetical protein